MIPSSGHIVECPQKNHLIGGGAGPSRALHSPILGDVVNLVDVESALQEGGHNSLA
jgi:hypothetical protein